MPSSICLYTCTLIAMIPVIKRCSSSSTLHAYTEIECLKAAATSSIREYTGVEMFDLRIPLRSQIQFLATLSR